MSWKTFVKIRKAAGKKSIRAKEWSESTCRDEIAELKRLGIIEIKQENRKYVFLLKFTSPEEINSLAEVRDDLDLGAVAFNKLSGKRRAEIKAALRSAVSIDKKSFPFMP